MQNFLSILTWESKYFTSHLLWAFLERSTKKSVSFLCLPLSLSSPAQCRTKKHFESPCYFSVGTSDSIAGEVHVSFLQLLSPLYPLRVIFTGLVLSLVLEHVKKKIEALFLRVTNVWLRTKRSIKLRIPKKCNFKSFYTCTCESRCSIRYIVHLGLLILQL